ncbi:GTP-binding protein [Planctomycetota bacterium]|nr:GTP-binding protein [Planctomycetota bacterium]
MIPLTLVTGFLGSGKTTLLKRFAANANGKKFAFLVNEYAQLDIDGQLMDDAADVIAIPGGSIFCRCLTTTFIEQLTTVAERNKAEQFDGVIIEASGVANPTVIRKMLIETELDQQFDIEHIIAVAEPNSLLKLLTTLPNIREQIQAADIVVLNKIDLAGDDEIEESMRKILEIQPNATISKSVNCDVDIELFNGQWNLDLDGEYAKCKDPHYSQSVISIDSKPTRSDLHGLLARLTGDVYRVKGWVNCFEGPTYIDISSGKLSITPVKTMEHKPSALAVIYNSESTIDFEMINTTVA